MADAMSGLSTVLSAFEGSAQKIKEEEEKVGEECRLLVTAAISRLLSKAEELEKEWKGVEERVTYATMSAAKEIEDLAQGVGRCCSMAERVEEVLSVLIERACISMAKEETVKERTRREEAEEEMTRQEEELMEAKSSLLMEVNIREGRKVKEDGGGGKKEEERRDTKKNGNIRSSSGLEAIQIEVDAEMEAALDAFYDDE